MSVTDPPPGSPEAKRAGCLCPTIDNAHGRGFMGGVHDDAGELVYVQVVGCPLHYPVTVGDDEGVRDA